MKITSTLAIASALVLGVTGFTAIPALAKASAENSVAGVFGEDFNPGQGHGKFREVIRTAMRHLLNFRHETPLTAEQKQKARSVMESHRSEIHTQMEKGRDARRAMFHAVTASGPDAAATKEAADKIGNAARDRALLMAKVASEIKPLLTAEQLKRVEAARTEIESEVDAAIAAPLN